MQIIYAVFDGSVIWEGSGKIFTILVIYLQSIIMCNFLIFFLFLKML